MNYSRNNNTKYTQLDFAASQNDTTCREQRRPQKIRGEGTPGKFYFRITNPKYQLVEITLKFINILYDLRYYCAIFIMNNNSRDGRSNTRLYDFITHRFSLDIFIFNVSLYTVF